MLMTETGEPVCLSQISTSDANTRAASAPPAASQTEPDDIPAKKAKRKRTSAGEPKPPKPPKVPKPPKATKKRANKENDTKPNWTRGLTVNNPDPDSDESEVEFPDESDCDTTYELERIVQHKGSGANLKFLVKWRGFDESFDSWEPEINLSPSDVAEYMSSVPPPKPRKPPAAPPAAAPVAPVLVAPVSSVATISRSDGCRTTELRKRASEDSAFTGFFVIDGEHVTVLGTDGCFSKIKSGRQTGFIQTEYLAPAEDEL